MIPTADLAALAMRSGLGEAQIVLSSLDGRPGQVAGSGPALYPASLIKVPLAAAAAVAVASGRLGWDDPVTIAAANATLNDAPSPMEPGYRSTVAELTAYALERSDNVATNQLYDVLGRARATADVQALGLRGTAFRRKLSGSLPLIDDPEADGRNTHPAEDAAELFAAIARGSVPDAGRLHRLLARSWWDVKLSRGLEPGDAFAHKTGDTDDVSHDGGILTLRDGSRWVLVVCTALPSSDVNDAAFGRFMRALRPHLTERAAGGASVGDPKGA